MKNTVSTLLKQKQEGKKISMLTCYDYSTTKLMEEVGVNTILVGDSLGNTMLGYEDTIQVTMEDMIHHCAAVSRGLKNTFLVCDMPFMSYQTSPYDAVVNAGRLMKEGHANMVKLEGGKEVCPQIEAIVKASIPVCAHLGLTPQSINALGGYKVQGKTESDAQKLIDDAKAVQEAGASMLVLECVPADLCSKNNKNTSYSNNRYWSRKPVRRTGTCISGHVRNVYRLRAKIRKTVCRCRRNNEKSIQRIYGRNPERSLPGRRTLIQNR